MEISITTGLPVHINVRFEEPLYNRIEQPSVIAEIKEIEEIAPQGMEHLENCAALWNASTKKMVLVGVNDPGKVEQQFLDLVQR